MMRALPVWIALLAAVAAGQQKGVKQGRVIKTTGNLVAISLGKGDGIKAGQQLHIRRGAQYVGRIKVIKAAANASVGEFDPQFKGPGAPPRKGDVVYENRARPAPPRVVERPPATVTGLVLTMKGKLVLISVGTNDGVKRGDIFQIRRGKTYVGQMTVQAIQQDSAVGAFDARFRGAAAPPQPGDVVYSGAGAPAGRLEVLEAKDGVVRISVTKKDRVKVGDFFRVLRGGKIVGRLKVTKVGEKSADGVLDPRLVSPLAPVVAGDTVEREGE